MDRKKECAIWSDSPIVAATGAPHTTGRSACLKALLLTACLLMMAAVVFTVFPRLDLVIDGMFASSVDPFPVKDRALWQSVRAIMIASTDGLMALSLVWMILGWSWQNLRIVKQRVLGFMVLVYAIVPGLVVNAGFKMHWGRARPRNILDFGGAARFTPPLQIADQCSGSCSFVSGETSALFTVATLLILIFVPLLPLRQRGFAMALIGAVAVFGSGLRVAFGAHFASDVIFAALIATASTLILYMVAGMDRIGDPIFAGPFRKPDHTELRPSQPG